LEGILNGFFLIAFGSWGSRMAAAFYFRALRLVTGDPSIQKI
jgi:hypothetical protein